jgi:hypothetical protein
MAQAPNIDGVLIQWGDRHRAVIVNDIMITPICTITVTVLSCEN